jgi:DNA polymerase III delta prime subunit
MITLPTTPQPALRINPKRLLLYGPPKVGKTTALTGLKNCLIVDCEEGSENVEALRVSVHNFAELEDCAKSIRAASHKYDYIALDTITAIEEWCEVEGTRMYKASGIGKNFTESTVLNLPNGAGYEWLRRAFHKVLFMFDGLAPHIILVGHLREKFISGKEQKTDSLVATKDLDLTGKIKAIAASKSDAIGYMFRDYKKDGRLSISFETQEAVNCGCRCPHLRGKTICLQEDKNKPSEINWKEVYL